MWKRYQIKSQAKQVLRSTYWKAFVVTLVLALIGGGLGGAGYWNGHNNGTQYNYHYQSDFDFNDHSFDSFSDGVERIFDQTAYFFQFNNPRHGMWVNPIYSSVVMIIMLIATAFSIVFNTFLTNPLVAGGMKYFISAPYGDANVGYLGHTFGSGRYMNTVKTLFLRDLFVFLWSLLLVIPGIIMSYAYRMVPYIIADNPAMDHRDALRQSRDMMRGNKFRAFILDLSFIGWYFLGMLACGIGIFFVLPYHAQTNAQLYLFLRDGTADNTPASPASPDNLDEPVATVEIV